MGIRFLAITFLNNRTEIIYDNSGDYYLSTVFDAFLKKSYFWRENGREATPRWRQGVWDLNTRPKNWPNGWTFWVNCYLENMFSKFSGLNPSPKVSCDWYILTKFPGYVEHRRTFSPQILIHIWTSLIFAYSNHFYVAHSMDMNLCPLLIRKINWAHFDEKCQSYGQFMANWMFVTNTTRKNSN